MHIRYSYGSGKEMNTDTQERRDYGFMIGLLAGTCIGGGLAMLFAPRSGSDLRHQMADSAKDLGERASQQYQQVSSRVGEAVEDITRKGQDVRDDVVEAVARGAHDVEQFATARSARTSETRKHPASESKSHSL
jgi:gas vesicle protein